MSAEETEIITALETKVGNIAPYKWEQDSIPQSILTEQGLIDPDRVYSTLYIHILSPAFQTIVDAAKDLLPYQSNAYSAMERYIVFDVTPETGNK